MTVRFAVNTSGAVSTAAVEPADGVGAEVASCIARTFEDMALPSPGGVLIVTYPILMGPE